jgi:hypothetical protein
MDAPLPDRHINVRTPLRPFLERIAAIADSTGQVRADLVLDHLGDEGHDILGLSAVDSSPHMELCGKLIVRPEEPGRVTVEIVARDWSPAFPPSYEVYRDSARRIFDPVLAVYNREEKKRLSLVIESEEAVEPKLPPKTAELFEVFLLSANRQMLHPLDWKLFYNFVRFSTNKIPLSSVDMARLLVKARFPEDYAQEIGIIYQHLCEYRKNGG